MEKVIAIPYGQMAADDTVLKAKREALKKKLLEGGKITLKQDGGVTDGSVAQDSTISIPKGKLAAQWYEINPMLLEAEKFAMAKFFPNFTLDRLEDGRLYWIGSLTPGVYKSANGTYKKYTVMAVYMNNHPAKEMGSTVRVYPLDPDIEYLENEYGEFPPHILRDSINEYFLCTAQAGDIKNDKDVTTAASVLAWACKWFLAYELVLSGTLSKREFETHGVI